jgi:hypothetical protein
MNSSYVSSVLVIIAFIGLAFLPQIIRKARLLQTRSWPNVNGSIESAWVSLEQRGKNQFFKGKLAYSYSVQSQHYSGEMERNFGGSESKANAWVARFPHGLPVQVRYSPNDASNSAFDDREHHSAA